MSAEEKRETRIIRCPACRRYYRIAAGPPAPGTRLRCSKCGEVFLLAAAVAEGAPAAEAPSLSPSLSPSSASASAPAPAPAPAAGPAPAPAAEVGRPRVLVSTDGVEFQSLIGEVLTAAGFALKDARTGEEAWAAIESWRPHVALLDVALPGVPAFELCDRVRSSGQLQGTGLILIASVFQQTRYKRAPTSLYGADDYIEKHHIRDWLPGKIARLLPPGVADAAQAAAATAPETEAAAPAAAAAAGSAAEKQHGIIDEREQGVLMHEELYGPPGRERKGLERLQERLRRYARIIISDIALYNQELVERGIREGNFTELLKKEIEEGYRLYLVRVPASSGGEDYYHEAVREFITKRTGAQGGAPRLRGTP